MWCQVVWHMPETGCISGTKMSGMCLRQTMQCWWVDKSGGMDERNGAEGDKNNILFP